MPTTSLDVVTQFSEALDRDDFEVAAKRMTNDCVFENSRETVLGSTAVCAMYERNSQRARSLFQHVRYFSMFDGRLADGGYRVQVVDQFEVNGDVCEYRSVQVVYLSSDPLVRRIVWEQLPGQREALQVFCEKHKVNL